MASDVIYYHPLTEDEIAMLNILLTDDEVEELDPLTEDEIKNLESLKEAFTARSTSNKPLIQKVPQILRSCYSSEDCVRYFKPTSIAIGPINHKREIDKDSRIERAEKCKLKLAALFIDEGEGEAEDFYKNVKKKINSLRNCYDPNELRHLDDKDLAWMFLVDGCALLAFIALDGNDAWERFSVENDLVSIEKVDFFLLENQLPYHLLEILIDSFVDDKKFFKKSIGEFIIRSLGSLTEQQQDQIQIDDSQPHPHEQQDQIQIDDSGPHHPHEQQHQNQIDYSQPHPPHEHQHQIQIDDSQPHPPHEQQHQNQIDYSQPHPPHEQQHQIQIDDSQPHPPHEQQEEEEEEEEAEPPYHLLDLLRRKLMGEKGEKQKGIDEDKGSYGLRLTAHKIKPPPPIGNIKELKDKGIRFKAREKKGTITDIDFKDHFCMPSLTLAPIFLRNTTVPLLLNLIAYELCPDFKNNCEITSHLSFLDSLIDTGEDVKELRRAGVLRNDLGSDEDAAQLFNKISNVLVSDLEMHLKLKNDIHTYCKSYKSHFSRLRASVQDKLTHTYFRSPWIFLALLGALAGLIMTGMQTYNSFQEDKLHD